MNHTLTFNWMMGFVIAAMALGAGQAQAAYVIPMIGGAQLGPMDGTPMKHLDISFDGTNLSVHVDDMVPTPLLRPLESPDEFDPAEPWAVLTDKAYNYQYGWNPAGFITLPSNSAIWVQRLSQDSGLESYQRPPASPPYASIFASDGDIWQWSGSMTHNVYAVLNPTQSVYSASYRVYLGDSVTGVALDGYGSDDVTLLFNATVSAVPEPGTAMMLTLAGAAMLRRRRTA
ncbi:PEP-CTERM sorting domain-containing protein [Planctomycetales bacterium ZRK34]|nr:PEP-CTERM sorting domain-containing protein [Planctomycetales bacterium ZRK34]